MHLLVNKRTEGVLGTSSVVGFPSAGITITQLSMFGVVFDPASLVFSLYTSTIEYN